MRFENLTLARDGAAAVLTITRPQVLNALNAATIGELHRAATLLRDDPSVRVITITGAGDRAFAAGADIGELAALEDGEQGMALSRRGQAAFDAIEQMGKPSIAAINGYALGGGCELAMACTVRIASESAVLGQPEVGLGLIPGYGGTQRLPRLVGRAAGLELLLTGRRIPAAEACRLGLVHRVVPSGELAAAARELAGELASKPPGAIRAIMDAVRRGAELPLHEGQALEAAIFGGLVGTADMREGTRAFLEKRAPRFGGE